MKKGAKLYTDGLDKCQRYYQRHKDRRLCTSCPNVAEPGRTLCSKHLAKKRNSMQAKRKKWREQGGQCVMCGRPVEPGMRSCPQNGCNINRQRLK